MKFKRRLTELMYEICTAESETQWDQNNCDLSLKHTSAKMIKYNLLWLFIMDKLWTSQ